MTRQYPLPLPHEETMDAEDLMVAASNRDAVGWIDRWPDWPSHCLILYGPSGSGKTHLARVWQTRADAELINVAELATVDLVALANVRAIAVEDADQDDADPAHEETLLHLYNMLREGRGHLLLTAQKAPAQWGIQLPDLRSRLLASPAVALGAPDDELLSALLIKQFHDRQIDIGTEVIDFLLPRLTRTPEAIRDAVAALDRASLAANRRITVALTKQVLEAIDASTLIKSPLT